MDKSKTTNFDEEDYAFVARLFREEIAPLKTIASNNLNIILSALDKCSGKKEELPKYPLTYDDPRNKELASLMRGIAEKAGR